MKRISRAYTHVRNDVAVEIVQVRSKGRCGTVSRARGINVNLYHGATLVLIHCA